MSLALYVDGWGKENTPAFLQEGSRERVSLSSLVPGSQGQARVMLYWGDTVANLHFLTWQWAKVLGQGSQPKVIKSFKQQPEKCNICDSVTQRGNLRKHIRMKHPSNFVKQSKYCILCKTEVESQQKHWKDEHEDTAKCDPCNKIFTSSNRYRCHLVQCHKTPLEKEKLSGLCKICNIFYKNLQQHEQRNHSNKILKCDHCDKLFSREGLSLHRQFVDGTSKKEQCPECNNFYIKLKGHIDSVHRGKRKQKKRQHPDRRNQTEVKCGMCDKTFIWKDVCSLNKHIGSNHILSLFDKFGIKIDPSTTDGVEREEIGRLITANSLTTKGKIQCQLCSREKDTKVSMVSHIKTHLGYNHKKGRSPQPHNYGPYVCQTCGKLLSGKYPQQVSQHRLKCDKKLLTKESDNYLEEVRKTEVSLEAGATKDAKWRRVRCPDCGLVILKEETEKHNMECQGEILTY